MRQYLEYISGINLIVLIAVGFSIVGLMVASDLNEKHIEDDKLNAKRVLGDASCSYLQGIESRLSELSGDGFKEIQTEVCKGLRDMSLSIFKKYKVKEYTS